MSHLPGNVPHFSTFLVDFDHLDPIYVRRPHGAQLQSSWDKLDELERRIHAFDWASMVIRDSRQCTTFIGDLATAFILGLEATFQVLSRERDQPHFEAWLATLPAYSLQCRGLRTLRNLEAHIKAGALRASAANGHVYTRFTNSSVTQPAVGWRLPHISQTEYNSLKPHGRKLASSEVDNWNNCVDSQFAANIFRDGLISLVAIVKQA